MGKIIRITPELRENLRAEFDKYLSTAKCQGGKIQFTRTLPGAKDRKATVFITPSAFAKMWALISGFSKEVAWHGRARRLDDETKDEYLIYDIMVYPQEVTGGTVNTDQMKYQDWILKFDDEVFHSIRFQGHSHVEMAVSPSSTDMDHQKKIIDQLGDEDFYIFMIWNKKAACHTKVYDMKKNVFFDNEDCTVRMVEDGVDFEAFMKEANEMVKDRVYTTPTYAGGYRGSYSGNADYSEFGRTPAGSSAAQPYTPVDTKPALPEAKPDEKKKETQEPTQKPRVPISGGYVMDYDDDNDDPFPTDSHAK